MKRTAFIACLVSLWQGLHAQSLTVADFLAVTAGPSRHFTDFVSRRGYMPTRIISHRDTLVYSYSLNPPRKTQVPDSAGHSLCLYVYDRGWSFAYRTASRPEYGQLLEQLQQHGFSHPADPPAADRLFQWHDLTVHVSRYRQDSSDVFEFVVEKRLLPASRDIRFAEDLLAFNSHENLVYIFGKANVKKDVYYFSEKEFSKCSVLFPNTNRQVIFIWNDEPDDYGLSYLLFGGGLPTGSSGLGNPAITESDWTLSNGLKPGMNLYELTRLNGGNIRFYGKSSEFEGMIVPENKGEINFRKTGVLLSCLNCTNSPLMEQTVIDSEQALEENKKIFVLSIMLDPSLVKLR
ncbi:MAG TPA: hypothetical protein VG870_05365 [Chitinophagaceae bacterium]|nr:hypothetical protein [Chitinophagaceae bacterium]